MATATTTAPAVAAPQAPRSPPRLKNDKGKLTELHGEPPLIIKRNDNGYLTRGRMLGEGGFARVYAATDSLTGLQKAVKVISKEQLKSTKTKTKVSLSWFGVACQVFRILDGFRSSIYASPDLRYNSFPFRHNITMSTLELLALCRD